MGRAFRTLAAGVGGYRRLGLPCAAACVLSLGLLGPSPALAAPTWTHVPDLSAPGENFTPEQQLAIAPNGDAVAIWARQTGGETIIEIASRRPGTNWSKAQVMSTTGSVGSRPQVAIDAAGEAVAIWEARVAGQSTIEAAFRSPLGVWSDSAPVFQGHGGAEPGVAVDEAGEAVAIWTKAGANGKFVAETASAGPDHAWTLPLPLSTSSNNSFECRIAIDPAGEALAVWNRIVSGAAQDIEVKARTAAGVWDRNPTPLSLTSKASLTPQIALSSTGEAFAVWATIENNEHHVISAASHPPGGQWSVKAISAPLESGFEPQIAISPSGEADVVWTESHQSEEIIETSVRQPGANWSQPATPLSVPQHISSGAQVAVPGSGEAMVVWQRSTEQGDIVIEAASRNAAGAWPQPQADAKLTDPAKDSGTPHIAIDANGEALALWDQQDQALHTIIQGSVFDPVAPKLAAVSIPTHGMVDEPLSFSASAADFSLLTVSWTFGDGASADAFGTTHSYAAPGSYEVTLEVTDASGNATSTSAQVRIVAAPVGGPPGGGTGNPPGQGPPSGHGHRHAAVAAGRAKLKGKSVVLALVCPGATDSPCQGIAKLNPVGKSQGTTLGQRRFQIGAGKRLALAIRLKPRGMTLLRTAAGRLRLSGDGVTPRVIRIVSRRGRRRGSAAGSGSRARARSASTQP